MSITIRANVSRMFESLEPWDVSNSIANLGKNAGQLTWQNALRIAADHASWLETPITDTCEGMREWAYETGAWDDEEIERWSEVECLALFAQNIASELRDVLDADNQDLAACARMCSETDWNTESAYPIGFYYVAPSGEYVRVDYYTGS